MFRIIDFQCEKFLDEFFMPSIRRLERKAYKLVYSCYKGDIPKLADDRASFERLLLFTLNNVINRRYDAKKKYFRVGLSLQRSSSGIDSDRYELLARNFVALAYLFFQDRHDESLAAPFISAIKNCIDPGSGFYLGRIKSNQICVENASVILGFLVNPRLWDCLDPGEQSLFIKHIESSLCRKFSRNNWLWFKIFHWLFLEKITGRDCRTEIEKILLEIESLYMGEGWYRDGLTDNEIRYDNYTAIFYFFGLFFCYLADDRKYSQVKATIKSRFALMRRYFLLCYGEKGLPLTWGRSKLYRFLGLYCFGPALFLDLIPPHEMPHLKKIIIGTVNEFLNRGIFDSRGMMTMGYLGPNVSVLEKYSGDGSPYISLNIFSLLLLPKEHPFWQIDTSANDRTAPSKSLLCKPLNLYFHQYDDHRLVYNAGMNSKGYSIKYNKFAYSNVFPEVTGGKHLDNNFVFLNSKSNLYRDFIINCDNSGDDIMHLHWGVSKIKDLEAYSTLVPVSSGYFLLNIFYSPEKQEYLFGGFTLPAHNVSSTVQDDFITLEGAGLNSRLRVIEPRDAGLRYIHISKKMILNNKNSVLPYFQSVLPQGRSTVNICVQACCSNAKFDEVRFFEDQQGYIHIKENGRERKLKEKDGFYQPV